MLKKIIEKCMTLNIYEKRTISDEYCELVYRNEDIEKLTDIFTDILGPVAKPPRCKPTKEDTILTKEYGGIYDNQTLFKGESQEAVIVAMLWPWSDGAHTTLKLALAKK